MFIFCKRCGERLPNGAAFCIQCGAAVSYGWQQTGGPVKGFGIQPGFSDRINDPAVRAAVKRNKKATGVFAFILVLAPIIITLILGIKDNDYKYIGYGAIISAVFLVFNLVSAIKKKTEKQWDGVVIDKHTELRQERSLSDGDSNYSTHTVYIVRIQKDRGGMKTLEEREYNRPYYEYLNLGDRVRYHPQFNYYYEKFDKSHDSYAICPVCGSRNNIERDTCARCGVPVIK